MCVVQDGDHKGGSAEVKKRRNGTARSDRSCRLNAKRNEYEPQGCTNYRAALLKVRPWQAGPSQQASPTGPHLPGRQPWPAAAGTQCRVLHPASWHPMPTDTKAHRGALRRRSLTAALQPAPSAVGCARRRSSAGWRGGARAFAARHAEPWCAGRLSARRAEPMCSVWGTRAGARGGCWAELSRGHRVAWKVAATRGAQRRPKWRSAAAQSGA